MKTFKKIVILLIALLAIGIIYCNKVEASTGGKSAEDAINWCRSKEGQWVRTGQCVTFVSAYYEFLGQQTPSYYNAKELINHVSDQPAGWTVINDSNVQPQMGDILVYTGTYGHVAIYEADNAIWHANWGEGSGDDGTVVRWYGNGYRNLSGVTFVGVVRPDFNSTTDKESPVFNSGEIILSSINSNSFKVRVNATDNVGIDYINLGVKTETEDWTWHGMTPVGNNNYEYTVTTSGRGKKNGVYRIDCYAFDKAGNQSGLQVGYHTMGSTITTNLGDFIARIAYKNNTNYVIGTVDETSTLTKTVTTYAALNSKSAPNANQIWKFVKQSDNTYKIINMANSKALTVKSSSDNNGTRLSVTTDKSGDNQKFYIMSYNGGYRIVPKCSKAEKGLDLYNDGLSENNRIQIYSGLSSANNAQTWIFEKVSKLNGLYKVNGTWYYYNNNKIDTSYTGLVKYSGVWFYVNNGAVNWNYTGLVKYNGSWFYIQKGELKWGVNTLVKYNGVWFYINNSMIDWNYTGLFKYNGSWFYIQGGQLKWGANTLVKHNGVWFYINNSMIDWNYTGLFKYNGSTFYIQQGQLKWGYNGKVKYNGKVYNVVNSTVV